MMQLPRTVPSPDFTTMNATPLATTPLTRRQLVATACCAATAWPVLAAPPSAPAKPIEGINYSLVQPPVKSESGSQVEVLAFFSYGCPHCSAFEPSLQAWAKKLPASVAFKRVPVPFLANGAAYQQLYYALESLGKVDALHQKVFDAIHADKKRLDKPALMAAFLARHRVDKDDFLEAYKSFAVATAAKKAGILTASYQLETIPMLTIQGRYFVSPGQKGGREKALWAASELLKPLLPKA